MKHVDLDGLFPTDSDGNQPSPSRPPLKGPPILVGQMNPTINLNPPHSPGPITPPAPPPPSPEPVNFGYVWDGIVQISSMKGQSAIDFGDAIVNASITKGQSAELLGNVVDDLIMLTFAAKAQTGIDTYNWIAENSQLLSDTMMWLGVFTYIAGKKASGTVIGIPLGMALKVLGGISTFGGVIFRYFPDRTFDIDVLTLVLEDIFRDPDRRGLRYLLEIILGNNEECCLE